jgi:hypothetical protein
MSLRGLAQACVSSRKHIVPSQCSVPSKSCERVHTRPCIVRCLCLAVLCIGHWRRMCSTVCGDVLQVHVVSTVGIGDGNLFFKNWAVYSAVKACPVISLKRVDVVARENLAGWEGSPASCWGGVFLRLCCMRRIWWGLPSGGFVQAVQLARDVHGLWCHQSSHFQMASTFACCHW